MTAATTASTTTHDPAAHFQALARAQLEADAGPAWLMKARQAGLSRLTELGMPTLKDEEWRFTNPAPLIKQPYALPA
ncbi:MAG TPA: hypothetical protein VF184_09310, partial [Phycisphaeraceae bacterium]